MSCRPRWKGRSQDKAAHTAMRDGIVDSLLRRHRAAHPDRPARRGEGIRAYGGTDGPLRRAVLGGLVTCAWLVVAGCAPPRAPDYGRPASWAAFPGQRSAALVAVRDAAPPSAVPAADVFFVHPTTYLSMGVGNAAFDEPGPAGLLNLVLRNQASVFNACCRIYAPRYRQASLRAIRGAGPAELAAQELAYQDVARAFDAFLGNLGERPFVLAAHSQGSRHLLRLLEERVAGQALQSRLIVAYVVGTSVPREIETLGLPICRRADQVRCVVSWNSVAVGHDDPRRRQSVEIWWQGRYRPVAGRALVCVNPLSWHPDDQAPASANQGALPKGKSEGPLPALIPEVTGARCVNGLLEVAPRPEVARQFSNVLTIFGSYHIFDYNLFYLNLRENVGERVAAFGFERR